MPEKIEGRLEIVDPTNHKVRIQLTGSGGITAGGNGQDGSIVFINKDGKIIGMIGGMGGTAALGGLLLINDSSGTTRLSFKALDSELTIGEIFKFLDGTLRLGSGNKHGKLLLRNAAGQAVVTLDAETAAVKSGHEFDYLNGSLRIGGPGHSGKITLRSNGNEDTVIIDGEKGDVIIPNADCAEDFDLQSGEENIPGAVMVLGEDGSVRQSEREYDSAVAGVISGAGSYRPGIVLDRRASAQPRVPLAMFGKVFCFVDADFGAIRPGSLLTTSPRRGHAMLASEPSRAFGAVLGKALRPLEVGQGLIPVMVALQ